MFNIVLFFLSLSLSLLSRVLLVLLVLPVLLVLVVARYEFLICISSFFQSFSTSLIILFSLPAGSSWSTWRQG